MGKSKSICCRYLPNKRFLTNGVLEGYNTVDAVALLALSVTFVHAVRDLGFKDKKVHRINSKAGSLERCARSHDLFWTCSSRCDEFE